MPDRLVLLHLPDVPGRQRDLHRALRGLPARLHRRLRRHPPRVRLHIRHGSRRHPRDPGLRRPPDELEEPVERGRLPNADCVPDDCAGVYGGRHLYVPEKDRVCVWQGGVED